MSVLLSNDRLWLMQVWEGHDRPGLRHAWDGFKVLRVVERLL